MQAKGKIILYADADNATDISDFKRLYDEVGAEVKRVDY